MSLRNIRNKYHKISERYDYEENPHISFDDCQEIAQDIKDGYMDGECDDFFWDFSIDLSGEDGNDGDISDLGENLAKYTIEDITSGIEQRNLHDIINIEYTPKTLLEKLVADDYQKNFPHLIKKFEDKETGVTSYYWRVRYRVYIFEKDEDDYENESRKRMSLRNRKSETYEKNGSYKDYWFEFCKEIKEYMRKNDTSFEEAIENNIYDNLISYHDIIQTWVDMPSNAGSRLSEITDLMLEDIKEGAYDNEDLINKIVLNESANFNREIWEGWTVKDFIEELEPIVQMIYRGQALDKPFRNREELKRWCIDNQPYYKKYIKEVVDYFEDKYGYRNSLW